ncbi:MAG: hypothetical protein ACKOW9_03205 [Candidatus Paceibacterota bacterium]
MSLSTGSLTAWVKDNGDLIPEMIAVVPTLQRPEIMKYTGLKGTQRVSTIDDTINIQADGCGLTDTGTTSLASVSITVDDLTDFTSYCVNDLNGYGVSNKMNAGSKDDQLPEEEIFVQNRLNKLSLAIQDILWSAAKTGHNGRAATTYTSTDGIERKIWEASASTVNVTATGLTSSNVVAGVDTITGNIPADNQNVIPYYFYVPVSFANTIVQGLRTANLFSYQPDYDIMNGFVFPNALNVTIVPTQKLSTSYAYLIPEKTILFGTDLENEQENIDIWHEKKDNKVYFKTNWKQGVNVVRPANIVRVRLA